jgi:predicted dehydrogenase
MAALTVGAGLPVWYAREVLGQEEEAEAAARRPVQANDRIIMGAIGVGTNYTRRAGGGPVRGERGIQIMQDAMRQTGVQYVAVCDVDRHNRGFAANLVGRDCRQYEDFRELLANRDINAVTIGTPDHWHSIIALAALRAGKDVYCEKPLTLTVNEGKALVRVAAATNKILQTGSQQRSDARFRQACEMVRNGRIGTVNLVHARIGTNPRGGPFRTTNPPDGLNWNFWLGQTPNVEYIPERCHYEFRWWYEYSGGKMTDWGAHHLDIAQWALGMDSSGPNEIEGTGVAPAMGNASYNCHPTFNITYTNNNGPNGTAGTRLRASGAEMEENGVRFEGTNGWIFVSRGRIQASDPAILNDPLPANATRLEVSTNHMGNFISCVRSRRQPICHVGVGHRSVSVCHIGNIALRMGQRLRWNPQEERFVDNEAANRWLSREMRAPWDAEFRRLAGNG